MPSRPAGLFAAVIALTLKLNLRSAIIPLTFVTDNQLAAAVGQDYI